MSAAFIALVMTPFIAVSWEMFSNLVAVAKHDESGLQGKSYVLLMKEPVHNLTAKICRKSK